MRRIRLGRPSPSLVISLVALFVALSGTAIAAGIVPRARLADRALNANKLQGLTASGVWSKPGPATTLGGKTFEQVLALIASTPGPASSIQEHITIVSTGWAINPAQVSRTAATCPAGKKVIAGGFDTSFGTPYALGSHPTSDGTGWVAVMATVDEGPTQGAAGGSVWAVCVG